MARDDFPGSDFGSSDVICLADRARPTKPSPRAWAKGGIRYECYLLALVSLIEPDVQKRAHWWCEDGIAELGGLTADELVSHGASDRLETFLLQILGGLRD